MCQFAHREQRTPEPGAEVDVVVQLEGADADRVVRRLLRQHHRWVAGDGLLHDTAHELGHRVSDNVSNRQYPARGPC